VALRLVNGSEIVKERVAMMEPPLRKEVISKVLFGVDFDVVLGVNLKSKG